MQQVALMTSQGFQVDETRLGLQTKSLLDRIPALQERQVAKRAGQAAMQSFQEQAGMENRLQPKDITLMARLLRQLGAVMQIFLVFLRKITK